MEEKLCCHLCNSNDKVEITDRALDAVPMCLRCYRTMHNEYEWTPGWWFWTIYYKMREMLNGNPTNTKSSDPSK